MKFQEEIYLENDPFSGADMDTDIRCHTAKIVSVRKPQDCMLAQLIGDKSPHQIMPGQLARYDHAIVDGEWGSYYSCLDCMDKWLIVEAGFEPSELRA